MAFRDLVRSRLAHRIYLVGLTQVAVVGAGFYAYAELNRPTRISMEEREQRVAERIASLLPDAAAVRAELVEVEEETGTTIAVVDPDGAIVATTIANDAPPCGHPPPPPGAMHGPGPPPGMDPPPEMGPPPFDFGGPPPRRPGPLCRTSFLPFPQGAVGRIEFRPTRPPPPPSPFGLPVVAFVLVVVGVSSWFLARSIARPLGALRDAAGAIGRGDLKTRANLSRRDELGDVARAFDEMAVQVEALLSAEKELVANVSHELRTPLSRIRVALDLAAEGDAERVRESLRDITDDLDELERLVSDVLTAARLDLGVASPRGIPPLRRAPTDVGDLLAEAARRFRGSHPERPLEEDVAADLPPVDGDPVLLRRVVDNLLENAHKYTEDAERPIGLRAHRDETALVVEVVDQGIGIAPVDLSGVFRPFFRVDRSRTRQTGGLGLGLALAKRIVEAHGGTIELESAPDEGTVARVRLPIAL